MAEVFRRIPGPYAAKAAIDLALMDWVGKKLGVPLYRYFGLGPRDAPLTTFSIGIGTPEITRQKVRGAEPFPVLKIKSVRSRHPEPAPTCPEIWWEDAMGDGRRDVQVEHLRKCPPRRLYIQRHDNKAQLQTGDRVSGNIKRPWTPTGR
jgi:L-alanine-DL-glutamate epimerase-like enolase superfamily enzyme